MPNGANPLGTFASLKPSGFGTSVKDESKTSTRPSWRSVANSWSFAIASPL